MHEKPRETGLYPAVKTFLTGLGYEVKGEISGCDIVGVKSNGQDSAQPAELVVITELKLGFTLDLLLQGVERSACADSLWLAVQATRRGRDRDTRIRKLCRLLGFGLLAVHVSQARVEVLTEPQPYRPRPHLAKRRAILSEHQRRRGDPSPGGTRGVPIVTAYRQEALACAQALRLAPGRPRDLRQLTPRAAAILQRNVYGWFVRIERGPLWPDVIRRSGIAPMAGLMPSRIYLAGPTVFEPNPHLLFDQMKAICARHGLVGVAPLDNQLSLEGLAPGPDLAAQIVQADIQLMRELDAGVFCLDGFRRGPEMDPGTAFEIGYMHALGKPLAGWTRDIRTYPERVRGFFAQTFNIMLNNETAASTGAQSGAARDPDGILVHSEGCLQNAMTQVGIELGGGRVHAHPDWLIAFGAAIADLAARLPS